MIIEKVEEQHTRQSNKQRVS